MGRNDKIERVRLPTLHFIVTEFARNRLTGVRPDTERRLTVDEPHFTATSKIRRRIECNRTQRSISIGSQRNGHNTAQVLKGKPDIRKVAVLHRRISSHRSRTLGDIVRRPVYIVILHRVQRNLLRGARRTVVQSIELSTVDTLFVTHNFENRIRSIRSGFQTVQQQPLRLLLAPDGNTIARRPKRFNLFTRTELNVFEIRARRRQACRDLGQRDEIVIPGRSGIHFSDIIRAGGHHQCRTCNHPKFFHDFTVNLELDNVIPTRRLRNHPSCPILRKQTLRSRSTRQIPPRPLHRQSQFRGPDIPPPLFCKVLISK